MTQHYKNKQILLLTTDCKVRLYNTPSFPSGVVRNPASLQLSTFRMSDCWLCSFIFQAHDVAARDRCLTSHHVLKWTCNFIPRNSNYRQHGSRAVRSADTTKYDKVNNTHNLCVCVCGLQYIDYTLSS